MYLFNRRSLAAPGQLQDAMGWAVRITEKVNSLSEMPVNLWTTMFSPQLGTLSWTVVVEDLHQLETLEAKTLADGGYTTLVQEGSNYSQGEPIDDGLVRFVHLDTNSDASVSHFASTVTTTLAPGHAAAGIEVGVEIAQKVTSVTGRPVSFGSSMSGDYGGVGWFVLYDSIDQMQAAQEALSGDAGFIELIDSRGSGAYQAGTAQQTIWRKLA